MECIHQFLTPLQHIVRCIHLYSSYLIGFSLDLSPHNRTYYGLTWSSKLLPLQMGSDICWYLYPLPTIRFEVIDRHLCSMASDGNYSSALKGVLQHAYHVTCSEVNALHLCSTGSDRNIEIFQYEYCIM